MLFRSDAYLEGFGFTDAKERWSGALISQMPPGGRALDLGCGAGVPLARKLSDRGFSVVGVDISARQIELARANVPSAEFILSDFANLKLPPDSFDGIAAFYSMNHLPRDQHAGVLVSIAGWLRPGGVLVANFGINNDPGWVGEWLGAPTFFSSFDAGTAERLVSAAGLAVHRAVIEKSENEDARFLWIVAAKEGS